MQEILVLDDCSRDDSLEVIPQVAKQAGRAIRMIVNESNSGSVFVQWRRAAEEAQGEFVWIAEADDLSDPDFLSRMTSLMAGEPNVKLAFSDSRTIDADGSPQWDSYKGYYASVEPDAFISHGRVRGGDCVRRFLAVKNLILNVSVVVWRRDALLQALELCGPELAGFRMAGDWLLYLTALAAPGARIDYEAKTLNVHRRHATSVTHALDADRHVGEIARCHGFARQILRCRPRLNRRESYLAEVAAQLGARPELSDAAE